MIAMKNTNLNDANVIKGDHRSTLEKLFNGIRITVKTTSYFDCLHNEK